MKKAIIILSAISLAFWIFVVIIGICIGFSTQEIIKNPEVSDVGEAIGLLFAAIFITLFSISGYVAAVLAGISILVCIASIIVICKTTNKKGLIIMGVTSIVFGNLVAGILTLVYNSKINKKEWNT